jgi:hypothetical protein
MLQKFRADEAGELCKNGAVPWYTRWMGGPSLALIRNCPTPFGPRTVYIQGEPDTFFSVPAACSRKGKRVMGYLTCEDGEWQFHAYAEKEKP